MTSSKQGYIVLQGLGQSGGINRPYFPSTRHLRGRSAKGFNHAYHLCSSETLVVDREQFHQHHVGQKDQYDLPENRKKRREKAERERQEREQKLVDAVKSRSISAPEFLAALKKKKKDKHLNIEVRAIVQNQEDFACTAAFRPENAASNNHQDIVTYDHSRVALQTLPEGVHSDYINASFIEGCGGIPNEYIASQGPNQKHRESVPIFWEMVWEQGVHCIVMTCALFQHAAQQCAKYWEDMLGKVKTVRHGDIEIRLEETESFMHMTVRTLIVTKEGCPSRLIRHFELTGLGDQDDVDAGLLVEYRRRVRLFFDSTTGPMLVHGRYGGGRTAVFIAVDYCLKQLEMENSVDIYSTVLHLRRFRKNMVRTLAQYRTIYETVAAFINSGHTVIPSSHLPAVVQRLSIRDPRINMTGIEQEYKNLEGLVKKIPFGECAAGHQVVNRNKSRDIMLQPPERARPCLQTGESVEDTDYINAVFVDGYQTVNSFIVTQWPQKNTVNDVWRLLYDHRINTLVVLNDVKHCRSYPTFWPQKVGATQEQRFGPIGVRYINCIKYPHVIIRVFQIHKLPRQKLIKARDVGDLIHTTVLVAVYDLAKESIQLMRKLASMASKPKDSAPIQWRYVKMFQIRSDSWPSKEKVPSTIDPLVYLLNFVEEWEENNSIVKRPICVMSKDGVARCGVFCSLSVNCSKLQKEGDIDIYNTARLVKKNRPQLISSMEYTYSYMFMSRFVELLQENPPQIIVSRASQVYQNSAFEAMDQPVQPLANRAVNQIKGEELEVGPSSRRSSSASFRTAVEDANDLAKIDSGGAKKEYFLAASGSATQQRRASFVRMDAQELDDDDDDGLEDEEFSTPALMSSITQTALSVPLHFAVTNKHQTSTPIASIEPVNTEFSIKESVILPHGTTIREPSVASSYATAVPKPSDNSSGSATSLMSVDDRPAELEMSKLAQTSAPLAAQEADEIITPF